MEIELSEVDFALVEMLGQLEPTGFSNPTPVFLSRNVPVLQTRVVGSDSAHLQLDLSDGWREIKAIAFRQSAWAHEMPARIDLVYSLGINEWRGRRDLQLMVHDLNASDGQ
jgi:single-stranded-DNA-specific exonuclease